MVTFEAKWEDVGVTRQFSGKNEMECLRKAIQFMPGTYPDEFLQAKQPMTPERIRKLEEEAQAAVAATMSYLQAAEAAQRVRRANPDYMRCQAASFTGSGLFTAMTEKHIQELEEPFLYYEEDYPLWLLALEAHVANDNPAAACETAMVEI